MINLKQQPVSPLNQSGFTIIESLVAIIVVAVLLAAISPVIVLSVATRVQARRVELATDAAKSYIDGVRSGTLAAPPSISTDISQYSAPTTTGSLACNHNSYCSLPSTDLFCIAANGASCVNTNAKDLVIQAFRYNSTSSDVNSGYTLGLRIYRADAFKSGITLKASNNGTRQQQTFTGGSGLSSSQSPLVEVTTEISNSSTTFDNFCQRLKNSSNPKAGC
ncbi:MAG: type II secretion system protein [Nostocaceae cyanobacterium]|nr:type II secretion system protein [Nostocaceae cyanobacterium]